MTRPTEGKAIWSAEHALPQPVARPPREVLRDLERAAAARPWETRNWSAALAELLRGAVADDDIGAGASTAGANPLAVAVVTPYHGEDPAVLRRCHQSVLAQTYPCRHIMVADGLPRDEIDGWNVEHLRLERPHADYGDTPRAAGGERARALGYDAIAYLDADNAFRSHHVESLVSRRVATGAAVIFSGRTLHFPDGRMLPSVDPEDGRAHIDTSCLFLAGEARAMASAWVAYPRPLAMIGDRMVVQMLQARKLPFACTGALTVRYTVNFAHVYRAQSLPVPQDARPDFDIAPVAAYCRSLSPEQRQRLDATLGFPAAAFLRDYVRFWGAAVD